jgi:Uma2 family endonuclease
MATQAVTHHKFSVKDYYRMAEAGILRADERVELIEGEIFEMPPIGSPHASVVTRLHTLLLRRLSSENAASVRVQSPVRLSDISEPVPDIAIVTYRADFYRDAHPTPSDVLLLVEVADTSVRFDKEKKVPLYARSRIAEVWVVDLNTSTVDVHREPSVRGYALSETFAAGSGAVIEAPGGASISIDELFA